MLTRSLFPPQINSMLSLQSSAITSCSARSLVTRETSTRPSGKHSHHLGQPCPLLELTSVSLSTTGCRRVFERWSRRRSRSETESVRDRRHPSKSSEKKTFRPKTTTSVRPARRFRTFPRSPALAPRPSAASSTPLSSAVAPRTSRRSDFASRTRTSSSFRTTSTRRPPFRPLGNLACRRSSRTARPLPSSRSELSSPKPNGHPISSPSSRPSRRTSIGPTSSSPRRPCSSRASPPAGRREEVDRGSRPQHRRTSRWRTPRRAPSRLGPSRLSSTSFKGWISLDSTHPRSSTFAPSSNGPRLPFASY
jgi:hypothetical protein